MTKRELFVKAHKLTKEIVKETGVNYRTQFGICLSFLYEEEKKVTVEEKLSGLGYKVWEKYNCKRIYINNLTRLAEKMEHKYDERVGFDRVTMYYDILKDEFCFDSCGSCVRREVKNLIKAIRQSVA